MLDYKVIAPSFEAPRVRFASYDLLPVGEFAARRGVLMPFLDVNQDDKFNPDIEAGGRCNQDLKECQIDDHRLRVISSNTDCPTTTGVWLIGNVYDRTGRSVTASLCDEQGTCSKRHEHVFGDTPVEAIWSPDLSTFSSSKEISVSAGVRAFRYENIKLPQAIHLLSTHMEQHGDLRITLTADQPVDLAVVRVARGSATEWSSSRQPERVQARGGELIVELPGDLLDACGDACEAFVQLAHVWRDDEVFSVSQLEHKIF